MEKIKPRSVMSKEIPGFPNYKVLSTGEVFNRKKLKNVTKRMINGYVAVVLSDKGISEQFYMQRLVATSFVDNPNPGTFNRVRHRDRNKLNNQYDNLVWDSHAGACLKGDTGIKETPVRELHPQLSKQA